MEAKDGGENVLKAEETSPVERLNSSARSSSSSSMSSEFAFEDPLPADTFEHSRSVPKQKHAKEEFNQPEASSPSNASNSDPENDAGSPLQSPPEQVMERPDDSSEYRIPSYVFARNKSGTPVEWSSASNESLFSIHTGNMSYTRDQFNWLLKSGELNYADIKSGQLPLMPGDPNKSGEQVQSPASIPSKSGEQVTAAQVLSAPASQPLADSGAAAANKVESNAEASSTQRKGRQSVGEEAPPLCADRHSDASGQSFAFPVLTAETERGSSVASGTEHTAESKPSQEEPPPSAPTPEATQSSSWFSSCFSCCPCRS